MPAERLRVLVANIGNKDANPFDLALQFYYSDENGSGEFYVDKLGGLKAGEEKWLAYSPMCCGFVKTVFVVNSTKTFQAIADPTYYHTYGPYDPRTYEVKSKITESNKRNNTLTIARPEMKRCDLKNIGRPAIPKIQTIKPVRP